MGSSRLLAPHTFIHLFGIVLVRVVGFEPTRSCAPTDFKSVAWAVRLHPDKIQDLFVMRPRTSLVLSEIAVHRSRIRNSVKPLTSYRRVRPDRRFSALNTSFGMGKEGGPRGVLPSPNGSFSSYWRLPRKMQLVFSAILDAGIYLQSVYSLSTRHSRIRFFNVHFTALLHGQMVYFLLAIATEHRKRKLATSCGRT